MNIEGRELIMWTNKFDETVLYDACSSKRVSLHLDIILKWIDEVGGRELITHDKGLAFINYCIPYIMKHVLE